MKRDLPGSSGDADVMADWSAASVFSSFSTFP
jgi:tRNA pseudouridine-54 N-methylase